MEADRNISCHGKLEVLDSDFGSEYGTSSINSLFLPDKEREKSLAFTPFQSIILLIYLLPAPSLLVRARAEEIREREKSVA